MKHRFIGTAAALLAALMCTAAFSACTGVNKTIDKNETTAEATAAAVTTAAEETTSVPPSEAMTHAADEYIRIVRQEKWTMPWGEQTLECTCVQPELTFSSEDAGEANSELAEHCRFVFESLDRGEEMSNVSKGVEYKAYLNGKTLSLVQITRAPVNQSVYYYVYNFDTESGTRLSDAELIEERALTTVEEARSRLSEREAEYFDQKASQVNGMQDMLDKAKERTLSDEYLDKARYYLADRNTLSAAFYYVWIAGAEAYCDTTEVFPHLPEY